MLEKKDGERGGELNAGIEGDRLRAVKPAIFIRRVTPRRTPKGPKETRQKRAKKRKANRQMRAALLSWSQECGRRRQ